MKVAQNLGIKLFAYSHRYDVLGMLGNLEYRTKYMRYNTVDGGITMSQMSRGRLIDDVRAGVKTLYRILIPGGVVFVTVLGITQIIRWDMERWRQYWSFTKESAEKLFAEVFPGDNLTIEAYGNVLVASSFLYELAARELLQEELDYHDPDYEFIITVRAVKASLKR